MPSTRSDGANFIVVANRLPVDLERSPDGTERWRHSPGGLVTALEPFLRSRHGAWVGWPGVADAEVDGFTDEGMMLEPVSLSAAEVRDYYEGFSNGTLWPLYHDVVAPPVFDRSWWDSYVKVEPAVRGRVREHRGGGRDGLGAGLPAAAGARDVAGAAARPADRVLPAHPVPAGRAVHAAAVADRDHPRAARGRPGRVPPAGWGAELPVAGSAAGRAWSRLVARSACGPGRGRCSSGTGRCGSARSRSRSTRPDWTRCRGARTWWRGLGRSGLTWVIRAKFCSASTGWTTPRGSTSGCTRSASCWKRAGSTRPMW